MAPEIIPIDPESERIMWSTLPKSPVRAALNNYLVNQIEVARDKLESCKPEELLSLQSDIRACRQLIGFLARKDKR